METVKKELQQIILSNIDLSREVGDEELLMMIDETVKKRAQENYLSMKEKQRLRKDVFNAIRRLDVLQELIEDDTITEIMINGEKDIFIEREGELIKVDRQFESEKKLLDIIQHIAAGSNRIINESNPIVDARLPDGSRVNIVLPPVAIGGPTVTIRKFPKETMTMDKLIEIGSITTEVACFLKKLVIAGYNIFISGGTGSGKTTFLNALSNYIPSEERIITIEDSAELQIKNIPNLVRMEVKNANIEGRNEISIRHLIKTSLRMRPDRIIVGEVRDASAIDMLQALNTGHNGMSTGHSNSPVDMLSRIETMVLLGAEIPLLAVRKQIASAIDIIIHLGRLRDRSRKVLEIVEILDCVDGEIEINPLFQFVEEAEDAKGHIIGSLQRTGGQLIQRQKLIKSGLELT
ncbi:MAG: CpaF family protein [Clostridiales bacterium]|nr:CpaF family protein [Clostridiales bacterium]